MAGVVLLSQSIRPCESGNARTFSQKVIVYDSRCGMSNAAFRTAPPIGGPSCKQFLIKVQAFKVAVCCWFPQDCFEAKEWDDAGRAVSERAGRVQHGTFICFDTVRQEQHASTHQLPQQQEATWPRKGLWQVCWMAAWRFYPHSDLCSLMSFYYMPLVYY